MMMRPIYNAVPDRKSGFSSCMPNDKEEMTMRFLVYVHNGSTGFNINIQQQKMKI